MRALQFTGADQFRVNEIDITRAGPRRGARRESQRRHLPLRPRAAGRSVHHPLRVPRRSPATSGPARWSGWAATSRVSAWATASSASASSGTTTSASASAVLPPSSSSPRSPGSTTSPTTSPGPRAPSSSRSAAATTRRSAPTTSTPATPCSCSGPDRSGSASWPRRWGTAPRSSWPSPQLPEGSSRAGSVPMTCSTPTSDGLRRAGAGRHRRRGCVGRLRGQRQAGGDGDGARGRLVPRPDRLHRDRRGWLRTGETRTLPVQGASGPRHHRVARRLAADPAIPVTDRDRPQPTRHLQPRPERTPRRRSPPFSRTARRSRSTSPRPLSSDSVGGDRPCAQECSMAAHDLRVEDRPDPQPRWARCSSRSALNGLCGTDATEYAKGPMMVPLVDRHPGSGHVGPTVLGHEFIGTVVDVAPDADDDLSTLDRAPRRLRRGRLVRLPAVGAPPAAPTCAPTTTRSDSPPTAAWPSSSPPPSAPSSPSRRAATTPRPRSRNPSPSVCTPSTVRASLPGTTSSCSAPARSAPSSSPACASIAAPSRSSTSTPSVLTWPDVSVRPPRWP